MGKGMKKILAVVLIAVLIVSGAAYYLFKAKGYETGTATLSDVLNSKSTRKIGSTSTIVSDESPYYALIGTPAALYYEKTTTPPTGFALNVTAPYVNISVNTLIPGSEWMVRYASPLLAVNPDTPSRGCIRFLDQYNNPPVVTIGDVPSTLSSDEREWESPTSVALGVSKSFDGSMKDMSLDVAKHFWKSSDGVILVRNDQEGYNQAVVAVTLASYVDIPVIVTNSVDEDVAKTLDGLGVKYSIVCGDMKGYKLTKHFSSVEEIQDWTISVVRQRLGENDVSYVTMANPNDIYDVKGANPITYTETGEIENSGAKAYPGRPEMGEGPPYYFNVPYMYANVKIDVTMDISNEAWGDDSGARVYVFVGVDGDGGGLDETNENDKIQFFGGSPAYENTGYEGGDPTGDGTYLSSFDGTPTSKFAHFYTEMPLFNDKGEHCIQLLGKIPTDDGGGPLSDMKTTYTLTITVEELDSYIYPRLHDVSSLAPYLTAYRKGVVLAKPEYMIYSNEYVKIKDSSNPASNLELIEPTNDRAGEVKKDLNNLLGRIAGGMPVGTDSEVIALANYYASKNDNGDYTYLGIIADPQMIPHYYYPSKGLGEDSIEGLEVAGDIAYSDIDADLDNPPYSLNERDPVFDLADGRITSFDVQDVSALLCRTFFYLEIIENMAGPENGAAGSGLGDYWKNSAFSAIGTEPPVGATISAAKKLGMMWGEAGFKVGDVAWSPASGSESSRQGAAWYYESANFVYICSHGFFYWYVPTGIRTYYYRETGAGGAFDVAHVKLMNFGPSVLWTDSCVTGRIDGLQMYNCLSNAFLHAGFNCYFGGTRSMWGTLYPMPDTYSGEKFGSLMAIYLYGYMTGYMWEGQSIQPASTEDASTGVALMLAKNYFVVTQGTDGAGENDDTIEEVILHGDPAFNPYEPNHEGMGA